MIILRGLNKAFGEKIIFSNFNLEIPDGRFVVISGDSGSGKSTLLNMIGGIEKPDSGSIIIEGRASGTVAIAATDLPLYLSASTTAQ